MMPAGELVIIAGRVKREAQAIETVGLALERLTPEEKDRVVAWACAYIGLPGIASDVHAVTSKNDRYNPGPHHPHEPF
jgi:hypothetical protein